jgi:hypothetical protein
MMLRERNETEYSDQTSPFSFWFSMIEWLEISLSTSLSWSEGKGEKV